MEIKLPERTTEQFVHLFAPEFKKLGDLIAFLKLDRVMEDLLIAGTTQLLGDTAFKSYNIAVEDIEKGLNEAMANIKEEELNQPKDGK